MHIAVKTLVPTVKPQSFHCALSARAGGVGHQTTGTCVQCVQSLYFRSTPESLNSVVPFFCPQPQLYA